MVYCSSRLVSFLYDATGCICSARRGLYCGCRILTQQWTPTWLSDSAAGHLKKFLVAFDASLGSMAQWCRAHGAYFRSLAPVVSVYKHWAFLQRRTTLCYLWYILRPSDRVDFTQEESIPDFIGADMVPLMRQIADRLSPSIEGRCWSSTPVAHSYAFIAFCAPRAHNFLVIPKSFVNQKLFVLHYILTTHSLSMIALTGFFRSGMAVTCTYLNWILLANLRFHKEHSLLDMCLNDWRKKSVLSCVTNHVNFVWHNRIPK